MVKQGSSSESSGLITRLEYWPLKRDVRLHFSKSWFLLQLFTVVSTTESYCTTNTEMNKTICTFTATSFKSECSPEYFILRCYWKVTGKLVDFQVQDVASPGLGGEDLEGRTSLWQLLPLHRICLLLWQTTNQNMCKWHLCILWFRKPVSMDSGNSSKPSSDSENSFSLFIFSF